VVNVRFREIDLLRSREFVGRKLAIAAVALDVTAAIVEHRAPRAELKILC
jgi:hypothetical protein